MTPTPASLPSTAIARLVERRYEYLRAHDYRGESARLQATADVEATLGAIAGAPAGVQLIGLLLDDTRSHPKAWGVRSRKMARAAVKHCRGEKRHGRPVVSSLGEEFDTPLLARKATGAAIYWALRTGGKSVGRRWWYAATAPDWAQRKAAKRLQGTTEAA